MSWEFLRDLGLVIFTFGGVNVLVVFALRRFLPRHLVSTVDVSFVATIGDAMMIAGASLALTAMAIGYLVPNESPL